MRFDCHEHGVDLFQGSRVIKLEYPALLGGAILVENAQIQHLLAVRAVLPPSLKGAGVLHTRLLIQVIGVEDQRPPFGIENSAVGLLGSAVTSNVIDLGYIKVACAH